MQIDNQGIALHVAEDGDPAGPPLVLLHGITSFAGTWDWIVPELAGRFRVLRLDFRGHGDSDRAPAGYSAAGYLSDAIAVCEQLAGGPSVVIGHSLGAMTALAMMQRRPDLVRAAVLEDPPMVPAARAGAPVAEGHALRDGFRVMRQSLPGLQAAGMTAQSVAGFLGGVPTASGVPMAATLEPDALVAMAGSLLTVDPTVLDPVLEGVFDPVVDPEQGVEPPTLIITADPAKPDAICDPDAARELAGRSAATEVVTVVGAGHLIHDEIASRAQFRALTLDFLDRFVERASRGVPS